MASDTEKSKKPASKTAFVKSLPEDMPAKEVVERAKKFGMKMSDKYVYVVRSNARRKAGSKRGPGRPPGGSHTAGASGEREFRRLILDLGVRRAEQLLSDTKKSATDIIAGR